MSVSGGDKRGSLWRSAVVAAVLGTATYAAAAPTIAVGAAGSPTAHAAGTLRGTDTAHLRYLRSSGSVLVEEGPVSGGVTGHMHATLDVGANFTGSFTFFLKGGTIVGHGTAVPHGSGRVESFSGTMVVTRGTGRYAHISGHGGMYGTFDRRTYNVVIQTTGTFHY